MTDRLRTIPDTKWLPAGVGMATSFRCALCNQPKSTPGRKLKRVNGLRQYVCKECK